MTQLNNLYTPDFQHKPNALRLYGLLSHLYDHSIERGIFFKAIFRPKQKNPYTYYVWMLLVAMLLSIVSYWLTQNSTAAFCVAIFFELVFFLVAELALQQGIKQFFEDNEVIKNLYQQPWRLRRPIIRYAFFCKALEARKQLPSIEELDECLNLIEINRSGRPASSTSFFRHPIVVTVIGIIVYSLNTLIASYIKEWHWDVFGTICFFVFLALLVGWMAYEFRHSVSKSDWELERCIRWYRMERQESLGNRDKLKKVDAKKA